MYGKISRCALLTAVLCALSSVAFSQTDRQCSNADLGGDYGFTFHGTNLELKVSFIIIGRFEADGKGIFKGTESESVNGKTARGPFTGTYAINPDCTGSAILRFEKSNVEAKLDFVLVEDGNEVLILDVGGGNVESGEAKRQFWKKKNR
ncbi:MAG: hypothetical protein WA738_19790 [Candidatus Angelobacter sp.]